MFSYIWMSNTWWGKLDLVHQTNISILQLDQRLDFCKLDCTKVCNKIIKSNLYRWHVLNNN